MISASTNGRTFQAKVPFGGVKKGESFRVAVPTQTNSNPPAAINQRSFATESPANKGWWNPENSIQIRAPQTMPGGTKFTTRYGERKIVVTVPDGGIQQGQIFSVPILNPS